MTAPGRLYFGHIAHRRLQPFEHAFRYSAFSMVVDIDRVDELARGLRLFSSERFNLFSFFVKDHGHRDGSALRPWVENELLKAGIDQHPERIEILCFPRILGFVFNPLSVYFCLDATGSLFAIVYEVKNTFGGQHAYVGEAANHPGADERAAPHGADKAFYVSPFIDMEAQYAFTTSLPGDHLHLTIDESGTDGPILWAGWFGRARAMTDGNLAKAFFRYPLMTLKVVFGIHWQAVRLLMKGAKYRPQPIDSKMESAANRTNETTHI